MAYITSIYLFVFFFSTNFGVEGNFFFALSFDYLLSFIKGELWFYQHLINRLSIAKSARWKSDGIFFNVFLFDNFFEDMDKQSPTTGRHTAATNGLWIRNSNVRSIRWINDNSIVSNSCFSHLWNKAKAIFLLSSYFDTSAVTHIMRLLQTFNSEHEK